MFKEYFEFGCKDLGIDCDFLIQSSSKDELMEIALDHFAKIHGKKEIQDGEKNEMHEAIRTITVI